MQAGLVILSVVFVHGCSGKAVDILTEPYSADQAAVERTVRSVFDAAAAKRLDELDAYHVYGPKFTKFDDWEPLTRHDAASAKKAEREAFQGLDAFSYKLNGLKVDVFGMTAIATFEMDYNVVMGKDKASAKARGTMVFVKDKGQWKITHEHFSAFKANP